MFSNLLERFQNFEAHHQVLFALLTAIGLIFFTWGTEKILEYYLAEKQILGFSIAIAVGLLILWLTKYTILQVM